MNIRPRSLDSCFWKKWQGTHFCYLLLFWSALACQAQTTVQEAVQVRNGIAFSMSGKVERSKDSTNTLAQISTSKVREKSPAPALVLTQPGSSLTTGADGAASVVVGSAGFARMGADTTIRLPDAPEKNQSSS
jgi:hypothetical protein